MRRVCLGRTAFVIAHRLTAVQHADQILVIKQGRVAERGTPAELLAEGTLFRELFRDQCGGGSAPETLPGMTA
jgi:ABC-type multidrug transport system fused ATPase/permease subunit